jgi:DNA-binding transcriptional LysR family regulator
LYREDWVCVAARESRFGNRISINDYLSAKHIVVGTYGGVQTIPDKQVAAIGGKRHSFIRVPYFGVALECLPGTDLLVTATSGLAPLIKANRKLRILKAPAELQSFYFLMAWHPRLNTDARHRWLREAIRAAAETRLPTRYPV